MCAGAERQADVQTRLKKYHSTCDAMAHLEGSALRAVNLRKAQRQPSTLLHTMSCAKQEARLLMEPKMMTNG